MNIFFLPQGRVLSRQSLQIIMKCTRLYFQLTQNRSFLPVILALALILKLNA